MSFHRSDEAKTVDHFVGNKIRIVTLDDAVVQIIVVAAILHVRCERWGQVLGLVLPDQVHHVIGNQSTRSRATARSSETQTGAADITSISLGSRPAARAPSFTKPRHQEIKSGSANCRMIPSATLPAMCRTLGP